MPVVRRFGMGVIWGGATMTGITLAADSTGWFAVGAGTVTGLCFLGWVSGVRFKLARIEHHARAGASTRDPDSRVYQSAAIPEAIRTTRFAFAKANSDDAAARANLDPLIAEVDVLIPDGPGGLPFRSTAARDIDFDDLADLQRPTSYALLPGTSPGALLLGARDSERHDDVPDPRGFVTSGRLPGVARRVGRGRRAMIAMCAGFAIAAASVSVALPDLSIVQETVEDAIDFVAGSGDVGDLGDSLEDALDDLAEVKPGSIDLIRSFELDSIGWTLTALDPERGQDFEITNSESEPSYGANATTPGTFSIDRASLPKLNDMYDDLLEHVDEYDVGDAVVAIPVGGSTPLVTYQIHGVSGIDEIQGTLDGQLAPMADPQSFPDTTENLYAALEDVGLSKDDVIFQEMVIRSSDPFAPDPGPPTFLESGGVGGQVKIPDGDYAGVNMLNVEVGKFPVIYQDSSLTTTDAATFSAAEIPADQLAKIVDLAAADAGVEQGDRNRMTVVITQPSTGSDVPVVSVQFGSGYGYHCWEITGAQSDYC